MRKVVKAHASPQEAFRCMRAHLKSKGYTPVGQREFMPPDGGPVLVLNKKCRYGGKMRNGKIGERIMPKRGGIVY